MVAVTVTKMEEKEGNVFGGMTAIDPGCISQKTLSLPFRGKICKREEKKRMHMERKENKMKRKEKEEEGHEE